MPDQALETIMSAMQDRRRRFYPSTQGADQVNKLPSTTDYLDLAGDVPGFIKDKVAAELMAGSKAPPVFADPAPQDLVDAISKDMSPLTSLPRVESLADILERQKQEEYNRRIQDMMEHTNEVKRRINQQYMHPNPNYRGY
jgi:hypothetical protein